jgi:hypothetical protein
MTPKPPSDFIKFPYNYFVFETLLSNIKQITTAIQMVKKDNLLNEEIAKGFIHYAFKTHRYWVSRLQELQELQELEKLIFYHEVIIPVIHYFIFEELSQIRGLSQTLKDMLLCCVNLKSHSTFSKEQLSKILDDTPLPSTFIVN